MILADWYVIDLVLVKQIPHLDDANYLVDTQVGSRPGTLRGRSRMPLRMIKKRSAALLLNRYTCDHVVFNAVFSYIKPNYHSVSIYHHLKAQHHNIDIW